MRKALLLVLLAAGCGRSGEPPPGERRPSKPETPDAGGKTIAAAPVAADAGLAATELETEEREQDPRSEKVKLKLHVSPAAEGVVHWGRKRLGELKPGQMTVEVERPRSSGPLDLTVRAEGFLPHHVRLFTDRDDKLFVRLVRPEEARGMLGYRRSPPDASEPLPLP